MFPTRYHPNRYFAPRYWPKVGEEAPDSTDFVDLQVEVDGLITRELAVDGVQSLYLEADGTASLEVEVLT
jgi:hypothetical protein